MGLISSLFGGATPSHSPGAVKFAGAMSAYLQSLNILFLGDPLEDQLRDTQTRKVILCFLFGAADFLGKHTQNLPDDTVLDGFAAALENGLGLSPSLAQKACGDAADWSGDRDGRLYMKQGAAAFAEFMDDGTPPSKALRTMLMFPPESLR